MLLAAVTNLVNAGRGRAPSIPQLNFPQDLWRWQLQSNTIFLRISIGFVAPISTFSKIISGDWIFWLLARIYIFTLYTEPTLTQHQIYTEPKFTRPQIYTASSI